MSALPRVSAVTRERAAREFDDRGPEVCRSEITRELEANNPELLDMARRCARDVGDFVRIMTGFCMFYHLLDLEAQTASTELPGAAERHALSLLPRVSAETRREIVRRIDALGAQAFTREALEELERNNPELLIMGHHFAEDQPNYIGVMQGFALVYASLVAQVAQERGTVH
jgi:hypothetical protein